MTTSAVIRIEGSDAIDPRTRIVDTRLDGTLVFNFIDKSGSEGTRKTYEATIREFIRFSGRHNALEVAVDDVIAWKNKLVDKKLSEHTICTKLATLSALFRYLCDLGVITRNPAASKLVPRPPKPLQSPKGRALSVYEVRHLLISIRRDNTTSLRDFAMVYLMLRMSLRVSEVSRMKTEDIKSANRRWIIDYKTKGGRRERQPLPDDVKQAIDDYLESDRENRRDTKTGAENDYLFQAEMSRRFYRHSRPLSPRHIWHIIQTHARQAGLGRLSPHDLRRTAITRAFAQNLPLTRILNMSKHKSVESLMIYNKARENLEENAVNELNYDGEA